jgi:very-short-patch-repair endonuclease
MARTKPDLLEHARSLRKQESAAEQFAVGTSQEPPSPWHQVGIKFVRQLAGGPFIADFACRERRLILEVDGATHSTDEEIARDRRRDDILSRAGWNVVRVSNHDVLTLMDSVLENILSHCGKP